MRLSAYSRNTHDSESARGATSTILMILTTGAPPDVLADGFAERRDQYRLGDPSQLPHRGYSSLHQRSRVRRPDARQSPDWQRGREASLGVGVSRTQPADKEPG